MEGRDGPPRAWFPTRPAAAAARNCGRRRHSPLTLATRQSVARGCRTAPLCGRHPKRSRTGLMMFVAMSLMVKICGLSTPEALDVALDAGADMVGFVFFPPSPRTSRFEAARTLGRAGATGGRKRWRSRSTPTMRCSMQSSRRCSRTCCNFTARNARRGWRRSRWRFGLPVMKAIAGRAKSRPGACGRICPVADRLLFDARAPRDGDAAWRARQAVRLAPSAKSRSRRAVHAVGRARCRQCRRGSADHAAPGRRCLLRRRARAGRKGPDKIRAFVRAARATAKTRLSASRCESGMTVQQPNSFRTGPDEHGHFGIYGGRFVAETLMPLILRTGDRPTPRPRPTGNSRRRWTAI